jgi:O-methyltransferase
VSRSTSWRGSANGILRSVTGLELKRAAAPKQAAPKAAAPKPAPAKPKAPAELNFPKDYDDEAREIIKAAKPYTMTSLEKLYALILATRYVSKHEIPGDVVECGVWRGGSMHAVGRTLDGLGDTKRHLHLYDTFEGMPPPTDKDRRQDGKLAEELLEKSDRDSGVWAVAGLDDVQAGMATVPYPEDHVHYHKGMVEETVPSEAPEQISILRLDTDWYASTLHELEHLYPRLSSGGVLLLDDYGWWQGSREAVDEFLAKTGFKLLLLRMDEGRIAVKP